MKSMKMNDSVVLFERPKRTMAEQMRLVIFYKVLMSRLNAIKSFEKNILAELAALKKPPLVLIDLYQSISYILGNSDEWSKIGPNSYCSLDNISPIKWNKIIHPSNIRAFQQINIIEVRRESMLPFRSFSAYYTFDDIRKINAAAAMLY